MSRSTASRPLSRATPAWAAALLLASCVQRTAPGASPGATAASEPPEAEAASSVLPEGKSVLGPEGTLAFGVFGAAEKVDRRVIDVSGQPFDRALEVEIKESGASEWEVQLSAPSAAAVERGDALSASFYARVTEEQESGGGETRFVFELARDPYTKSISYQVPLTPEWRQVHVRFNAKDDYAAGDAQMIFRLGYAPQKLQIGGIRVVNYGGAVPLARLPTTGGVDRRLAQKKPVVAPPLEPKDAGRLALTVQVDEVIGPISPYVYGLNSQQPEDTGVTVRRNGGNRGSVYNWETNYSNAGEDYHHQNDRWPCSVMGIDNCGDPAAQFLGFFEMNRAASAQTVVTVPMLDFVSADGDGPVNQRDAAPSERFLPSKPRKGQPFADTPDLGDQVVYQDEFVAYLVKKLGSAKQGGVKFYSLDNEPALWRSTHPRVHPDPTTYEEIVRRTEATAAAIKDVDGDAILLGGVMFGWGEYQSLSSAPDHDKHDGDYGSYLDYFLASMKKLEEKHGRRLVDVLDVHWYPEARGTQRITLEDASRSTIDARMQAPRSLWDPSYRERSWITQQTGKPIQLIRWLRERIDERYPGTKLAMTEYNFGATRHVSGGLAQVDVLGVLGREGVYLANYWGKGAGVGKLPPYVASAFRLYRNYDGEGGRFGDTAVRATVADDDVASVFAATGEGGVLTVVAINKHQQNRYAAELQIEGKRRFLSAQTYVIDASSPELRAGPQLRLAGRTLRHSLEPLSATLFVLR